jgi:hypothetical protein
VVGDMAWAIDSSSGLGERKDVYTFNGHMTYSKDLKQ